MQVVFCISQDVKYRSDLLQKGIMSNKFPPANLCFEALDLILLHVLCCGANF